MKKLLIILLIIAAIAANIPSAIASEEGMKNLDYVITITTKDDFLLVSEEFTIQGSTNDSYETLSVWIQTGAYDIGMLVDTNIPESRHEDSNIFLFNISSLSILKEDKTNVILSYKLERDMVFSKNLLRDTNSISVTFDGSEIYSGANLATNASFQLQLYKPSEPTLDLYIIVLIVLLVLIVAVLTLYTFRKQKPKNVKETAVVSEELLNTKKTLLMSLLKDIEKQHRAKQISDDTYNKLKEKYKQEAVEAMKQLEDLKLKVK